MDHEKKRLKGFKTHLSTTVCMPPIMPIPMPIPPPPPRGAGNSYSFGRPARFRAQSATGCRKREGRNVTTRKKKDRKESWKKKTYRRRRWGPCPVVTGRTRVVRRTCGTTACRNCDASCKVIRFQQAGSIVGPKVLIPGVRRLSLRMIKRRRVRVARKKARGRQDERIVQETDSNALVAARTSAQRLSQVTKLLLSRPHKLKGG